MNLVIDDAVEVKQATKVEPKEKRRELGIVFGILMANSKTPLNKSSRPDTIERGQCITYTSVTIIDYGTTPISMVS